MATNDGGPAFPLQIEDSLCCSRYQSGYGGMSLRDWFAGQALMGDFASQNPLTGMWTDATGDDVFLCRARVFYRFADAMLIARQSSETSE